MNQPPGEESHPDDQPLGSIPGVVPKVAPGFTGCGFRDRCAQAIDICAGDIPRHRTGSDHEYLCRLPQDWTHTGAAA